MSQGNGLEKVIVPWGCSSCALRWESLRFRTPPTNPSLSLTQARLTHPHYMLCAGPGCAPTQACLSLQDTVDASV